MAATTSVSRSWNQDIDGLLSGVKWAGASLTFSFPTSASYYEAGAAPNNELSTFSPLLAAQQNYVRWALSQYSAVINVTFTEIAESASQHADLRFARSDATSTAWAYFPTTSPAGGDSWYRSSGGSYDNPLRGNYAAHTFLHEIGHAMGLEHGHDSSNPFGALPAAHDSLEYSVMTYRTYSGGPTDGYTYSTWSAPQTLMQDDIAALQYMYGANFSTNAGNTVYNWSPTTGQMFVNGVGQTAPGGNKIFMTVWDGGGTDTYDFSNYGTGLSVDLRPGAWTTTSATQLAALGSGHNAVGNIANALLYNGDTRSLIENAVGGSGNDTLIGNQANNSLRGGAGNDTIDGVSGIDTALFSGARAQYQLSRLNTTSWQVVDLRSGSPDGTDTLYNIDYFQFSDLLFNTANNVPIVSATDRTLARGALVSASSLFSVSDADGDPIVTYRFYDQTSTALSGYWVVNGVAKGSVQNIDVPASQLAQTKFQAGVNATDQLWIQAFDGNQWSDWVSFRVSTANAAPVVIAVDQVVPRGQASVQASSMFSVSDADGDAIASYRLYDGTAGSGYWSVNGVTQGSMKNIDLTPAQFAQTTFVPGTGTDQLWVQVYDGFEWSSWVPFKVSAPVNHAPVVSASDITPTKLQSSLVASSLFSISDADGDAIATYRLYDGTAGSGYWSVNGVVQGSMKNIDLTPAQFAQTTFVPGTGTDQLWVQVYDGLEWSSWVPFKVSAPVNHAPVVSASDVTPTRSQSSLAASSLFSISDADGDAIVTYRLYDETAGSGYWSVNGAAQGEVRNIDLTPAQFAQTSFVPGAAGDQLWVQVSDGTAWSPWVPFKVNAPVNHAPVVAASDFAPMQGLSSLPASSLLSISDPDGDAIVAYRLYDQTADASSGYWSVNGVAQGAVRNIDLAPAQFAQATFVPGAVDDQLWVQVYDGFDWSAWVPFKANAPANAGVELDAPHELPHYVGLAHADIGAASEVGGTRATPVELTAAFDLATWQHQDLMPLV